MPKQIFPVIFKTARLEHNVTKLLVCSQEIAFQDQGTKPPAAGSQWGLGVDHPVLDFQDF